MGLIREIQGIKKDIKDLELLKQTKENEKESEKQYIDTLKEMLKIEILGTLYDNNNSYFYIVNNMYDLIDNVVLKVLKLEKTTFQTKTQHIDTDVVKVNIPQQQKRFNYSYDKIYNDINKIFYDVLNNIKKDDNYKIKFSNEEITNTLYIHLQNDFIELNKRYKNDYKNNFDILKRVDYRNSVINEIHKKTKIDVFTIEKNYNKALNLIKNKYDYDIKNNNIDKTKTIKIPLSIKIITFNKIIKSMFK